mmetsp:Transcript_17138/g.35354  ORF Transcript_17138/g.35354 Transcript_17138/m.35354 type:complete len:279 (-) Transcript_17138:555-1391(-)
MYSIHLCDLHRGVLDLGMFRDDRHGHADNLLGLGGNCLGLFLLFLGGRRQLGFGGQGSWIKARGKPNATRPRLTILEANLFGRRHPVVGFAARSIGITELLPAGSCGRRDVLALAQVAALPASDQSVDFGNGFGIKDRHGGVLPIFPPRATKHGTVDTPQSDTAHRAARRVAGRLAKGLGDDKNLQKFRSQETMQSIELGIVVGQGQTCRIPIRNRARKVRLGHRLGHGFAYGFRVDGIRGRLACQIGCLPRLHRQHRSSVRDIVHGGRVLDRSRNGR